MKFLAIILFITIPGIVFSQEEDSVSVFLVKQRWHTGIVINVAETDSSFFPELKLIRRFKYIDAGWGDDEFYRYPGFDLGLAIKALFINTPSTIRIEGFTFDIEKYISYCDTGFEIKLSRDSFNRLCSYISATFNKDSSNTPVLIESRYDGNITFYKAKGKYNMLNTCNTWVSRAFNKAGIEMDKNVIFVEQLFDEVDDLKNARRIK